VVLESVLTMKILQVSTEDIAGGAEKIAWTLHQGYKLKDQTSWLAVGRKKSDQSDILRIPNDNRQPWAQFWYNVGEKFYSLAPENQTVSKLYGFAKAIGQPQTWIDRQRGYENFDFPVTENLLNLPPEKPDILHCHNLHGDYFNLEALPKLSQQLPVFLTLHDAWLLSGHCAHSFDCDRWKIGCGQCPDLAIDPAIKRDSTAYNWQRKRNIYRQSKLYIATPSRWLMDKVQQSILSEGIIESRIIPNGIDLDIFHPADKNRAREELNLPRDASLILFAANGIRNNPWKDYQTMRKGIEILAEQMSERPIIFLALGEDSPPENIGLARIQFIPYQKDPSVIAKYYQAADIYLHAAKAETFGLVITEALACGTPVIGTKVGGIPELIEEGKNGFLVPVGDAVTMAITIQRILENPDLQQSMSREAIQKVHQSYNLQRMIDDYLNWYQAILQSHPKHTLAK
jgi:glycosyltransferase involved in cell wall biosynthesis